jgi:hypothetical protein
VDDVAVLSDDGSAWVTTVDDAPDGGMLGLKADGTGTLCGGSGRFLYMLRVLWRVPAAGVLRLTHLGSHPLWPAPDPDSDEPQLHPYRPAGEVVCEVGYTLTPVRLTLRVPRTGRTVAFGYVLDLRESPWPPDLDPVRDVPRRFFGHPRVLAGGGPGGPGDVPSAGGA